MNIKEMQEFNVNAIEATTISFVAKEEDLYNPVLAEYETKQCMAFSSEDTIIGYKNLKVRLYFTKWTLQCLLLKKYDKILPMPNPYGVSPDVISFQYSDHLPLNLCENIYEFTDYVRAEDPEYMFGDIQHEFFYNDREYIITQNLGKTQELSKFQRHFEIILGWFTRNCIRADPDDSNWIIHYLYLCCDMLRVPVGFSTIYLNAYKDRKYKAEITHFFIMPPYQKHGVGQQFLTYTYFIAQMTDGMTDIVIKNSSPAFDKMKDLVNTQCLLPMDFLSVHSLPTTFTPSLEKAIKCVLFIERKDAERVYEIIRLYRVLRRSKKEYNTFLKYLKSQYIFKPIPRHLKKYRRSEKYKHCTFDEYILQLWRVGLKMKRFFAYCCPRP